MVFEFDGYTDRDSVLRRWDPRYKIIALMILIFVFSFIKDLRLLPGHAGSQRGSFLPVGAFPFFSAGPDPAAGNLFSWSWSLFCLLYQEARSFSMWELWQLKRKAAWRCS